MAKKTRIQRRNITFRITGICYLMLTVAALSLMETSSGVAMILFLISMPFFVLVMLILSQQNHESILSDKNLAS